MHRLVKTHLHTMMSELLAKIEFIYHSLLVMYTGALRNLAVNDDNEAAIVRLGGIHALVELIQTGGSDEQLEAAGTLNHFG